MGLSTPNSDDCRIFVDGQVYASQFSAIHVGAGLLEDGGTVNIDVA
ncbi:aspartyl/asparaginyl beta-hydroxylase (cupin superfamily) [Pseudomonas sp. BS3782 TE3695]